MQNTKDRLPRRERERNKRRSEILRAAKWVFTQKGFSGASVDEVAERCELSKGTIYYYFGNKDKLFLNVLDELFEGFNGIISEATEIENTREAIRRLVEGTLTLFKRDYDLILIAFRERRRFQNSSFDDKVKDMPGEFKEILHNVEKIFQRGIERGEIKKYSPVFLATSLLGIIHGITHTYILDQKIQIDPVESGIMLTDFMFNGLKTH
jgi:AcrR family transcriptional regulator